MSDVARELREAELRMRRENAVEGEVAFCRCEGSDHWFDRSICPEPCGSMHNVCCECGRIQGYCAVAVMDRENGDRLAASWIAVADLLAVVEAWVCVNGGIPKDGEMSIVGRRALAVARAYLSPPEA